MNEWTLTKRKNKFRYRSGLWQWHVWITASFHPSIIQNSNLKAFLFWFVSWSSFDLSHVSGKTQSFSACLLWVNLHPKEIWVLRSFCLNASIFCVSWLPILGRGQQGGSLKESGTSPPSLKELRAWIRNTSICFHELQQFQELNLLLPIILKFSFSALRSAKDIYLFLYSFVCK